MRATTFVVELASDRIFEKKGRAGDLRKRKKME